MQFALMIRPNHNLAYFETYLQMCEVELKVLAYQCGDEISNIGRRTLNKATLLVWESPQDLSASLLTALYHASSFHTLFKVSAEAHYEAVLIDETPTFEDDLSIRLKYNGKTNEQITRFMLSIAYHCTQYTHLEPHKINLFDPMCGRGTTLFEGMIRGFNAYGVDKDRKSVAEMEAYITRYLKEARIKHHKTRGKAVFEGKTRGELFEFEYAKDKRDFKAKKRNKLKVLRGDTTSIKGVFKRNSMHMIVVDLPYNVQHNSRTEPGAGLAPLVRAGVDAWTPCLKTGGVIAMSWNCYTDTRESLSLILEEAGYDVHNEGMWLTLKHRVSQAITRDLIFAVKRELK